MRRYTVMLGALGLFLVAGLGTAKPSQADGSKYRGQWACSSESQISFFGPVAGVWLLEMDKAGNLTGEETTASGDPFLELSATFSGKMNALDNGSIRGQLAAHVTNPPGLPDSTFEMLCVGMDTRGGRYSEMRCLDVTDEPNGADVVGLVLCKRR